MPRRQSMIVIAIAVLFGLVAVYLVNIYLTGADRQNQVKALETTRIAVARVPLEFGQRLTAQNVRFVDWPAASVPPGSFHEMAEITPVGNTHVVLRPMVPGEPILRSKLSGEGGRATLSALLPANMRAASIRTSDVAGVAGFALPGDRVDVLLTREVGDEQITEVLLHNIRLIAIDQNANDNAQRPNLGRTATLEVSQEDSQRLALGSAVGTLSLVLRSVHASQDLVAYSNAIRSADLAGGSYSPPPYVQSASLPPVGPAPQVRRAAQPQRRGINIEVVRGTASRDYEVQAYGGL
jgi:pilus assembly protein CpaB